MSFSVQGDTFINKKMLSNIRTAQRLRNNRKNSNRVVGGEQPAFTSPMPGHSVFPATSSFLSGGRIHSAYSVPLAIERNLVGSALISDVSPLHIHSVNARYRHYMDRQIDLFIRQMPYLLARYEGRYIAFENGRVLASGNGMGEVLQQVNAERRAVRPVLVRRVQREYPSVEI